MIGDQEPQIASTYRERQSVHQVLAALAGLGLDASEHSSRASPVDILLFRPDTSLRLNYRVQVRSCDRRGRFKVVRNKYGDRFEMDEVDFISVPERASGEVYLIPLYCLRDCASKARVSRFPEWVLTPERARNLERPVPLTKGPPP